MQPNTDCWIVSFYVGFDDDDILAGILSDIDDDEDVKPKKPALTSALKKPAVKIPADDDESQSQGAYP